jgi:hypothetical protein
VSRRPERDDTRQVVEMNGCAGPKRGTDPTVQKLAEEAVIAIIERKNNGASVLRLGTVAKADIETIAAVFGEWATEQQSKLDVALKEIEVLKKGQICRCLGATYVQREIAEHDAETFSNLLGREYKVVKDGKWWRVIVEPRRTG